MFKELLPTSVTTPRRILLATTGMPGFTSVRGWVEVAIIFPVKLEIFIGKTFL